MPYLVVLIALAGAGCTWLFPVDGYDHRAHGDYADAVLADTPLAYWRLDEASGIVAIDRAGGHDGTYHDVALAAPGALADDTAASFGSNDSAVVVGNTLDLVGGAAFSLEAWAYPSAVDGSYKRIMTKRVDAAPAEGWSLTNSSAGLALDAEHAGMFVGGLTRPLPVGTWSHVAVTYDGITLRFYIDGDEANAMVTRVVMSGNDADLVLGSLSNAAGNAWRGSLDELAIYDHALPAARVRAHAEARE